MTNFLALKNSAALPHPHGVLIKTSVINRYLKENLIRLRFKSIYKSATLFSVTNTLAVALGTLEPSSPTDNPEQR